MIIRLSHSWFPIYAPPNKQKKTKKTLKIINHIFHSYYTQMLHVWNIYLHVQPKWPKCRWIFHRWSVWDIFHSYFQTFIHYIPHYFPESIFHSYFLLHGGFHEKNDHFGWISIYGTPHFWTIHWLYTRIKDIIYIIYIIFPLCNPCHVCHIFSGILQLRPGPREGSVSRSRLTNSS